MGRIGFAFACEEVRLTDTLVRIREVFAEEVPMLMLLLLLLLEMAAGLRPEGVTEDIVVVTDREVIDTEAVVVEGSPCSFPAPKRPLSTSLFSPRDSSMALSTGRETTLSSSER